MFAISPSGTETVLHSFQDGGDGAEPVADLIDVHGVLYGTTARGGLGNGTVFSITIGGHETVIYAFKSGRDGSYPAAGLIDVGDKLYGTTGIGGTNGCGTVFSVDPGTGAETVLYSFAGYRGNDGASPLAALVNFKGTLYGTTYEGGNLNVGTVYSITPGRAETVIHMFANGETDGAFPQAGLIAANGRLYGTTYQGWQWTNGGVFSIGAKGADKQVFPFGYPGYGDFPAAGLTATKSKLYGTTTKGGMHSFGTLFSIDLKSGAETTLYSFCSQANCSDGLSPESSPIHLHGTLYGTTAGGGAYGGGTVYSLIL